MNGRHPPIEYCPLTLNFKVVLEIYKKLNLRSKKREVPAREKKGANSVYREPDEYVQRT